MQTSKCITSSWEQRRSKHGGQCWLWYADKFNSYMSTESQYVPFARGKGDDPFWQDRKPISQVPEGCWQLGKCFCSPV